MRFMYCMKCDKHLSECECPDIEERMASLAGNPIVGIAIAQNVMERDAKKNNVKPEDN